MPNSSPIRCPDPDAMRVMLHAVMIAAAAAQHMSPLPGGWTGVVDRGSHCWIAIPPRWHIDDGTDRTTPVATSPDGQATAMLRWTSASDFVGRMKVLLGP